MGMVNRFHCGCAAILLVLAGCDPFSASDPETPTKAGSVQVATHPEKVPVLWAKGLLDSNVLQTERLVGDDFVGTSGGASFSRNSLSTCLATLAARDVDSAGFAWEANPTGETDSVWGEVRWSMVLAGGSRYGGRATWTVVRDDAAEWRIARWVEPATSGNWSDACGGF